MVRIAFEFHDPCRRLLLLGSAIILSSTAVARSPGQAVEHTVSIAPGAFEEPCFPLARYDRVEFEFGADGPLDFNLHYHDSDHDSGVFFPLDFRDVTSRKGQYVSPEARSYCLMWTNKQSRPVALDYRYRLYSEEASQ